MTFKVVRDRNNRVLACGPDKPSFDPVVPPGGRIEQSETFILPFEPNSHKIKRIERENEFTHEDLRELALAVASPNSKIYKKAKKAKDEIDAIGPGQGGGQGGNPN